jgi:dipeptide/tripeptide permease
MQFWYQQQACQMDLRIGGTQLAGSFFCIADCLGIVVATPLAVDWLNPVVERRSGGRFGHGAKYGLGMAFACVSVLMAARFEAERRLSPVLDADSNCAPPGVKMSAMPAAWMFGPFFVMGLGEIYTQPVLMHLSYSQSPKSMRTLTAATGLVIGAVSNALFTLQVAALAPFVPNDLNNGRLEVGYYGNVVLGGIFYMAYLTMLRGFEEKQFTD